MGIKEEGLPPRYLFGYAGQLRPLQKKAGKCLICKRFTWIDLPPVKPHGETKLYHYSCVPKEVNMMLQKGAR